MRVDIDKKVMRHCGSCNYCRDTCPMYIELGSELDSPGGKIRALRAYDSPYALLPFVLIFLEFLGAPT